MSRPAFSAACSPAFMAAATALVVMSLGVTPAAARKKADPDAAKLAQDSDKKDSDKKDADKKGDAGKPVQVATFGDWGAYLAKGKAKTCYALASPQERKPDAKHDTAYVFIADRPGEKVHNEVSIIMGFPMKEAGAQAKVGNASFDLVAKGANAWIKNPGEEAKFVAALQHGGKLLVKAPPVKGPAVTDTYSLAGLKPALERVSKDCK